MHLIYCEGLDGVTIAASSVTQAHVAVGHKVIRNVHRPHQLPFSSHMDVIGRGIALYMRSETSAQPNRIIVYHSMPNCWTLNLILKSVLSL